MDLTIRQVSMLKWRSCIPHAEWTPTALLHLSRFSHCRSIDFPLESSSSSFLPSPKSPTSSDNTQLMSERRCTTPISPLGSLLDSGFSKRLRFPLVTIWWPALFLWGESSPFLPLSLSSSGSFSLLLQDSAQFFLITQQHLYVFQKHPHCHLSSSWGYELLQIRELVFSTEFPEYKSYCPEKVPGNVCWKEVNMHSTLFEIRWVNASETGLTHHIFH